MKNISQKSIIGKVYKEIIDNNLFIKGEKVAVACSGGPDSICLLDILLKLQDRLGISVIVCHFNHRLRGVDSDKDEKFILDFCQKRGIDCFVGRAPEKNLYKNEEQAREARYLFFKKIIEEGRAKKISFAHQLNDFAETIILRIIRGTGISGIRSIPALREKFTRPLLHVSRKEIEDYLLKNNIQYRTDASNFDTTIPRNKIRHEIIPMLAEINPNITESLSVLGATASEDYELLELLAQKEFKKIATNINEREIILSHKDWIILHPSLRRMVLRLGLKKLSGLDDITFKQIEEVSLMLCKGEGKKYKILPHSLYIELRSGKIVMFKKI
jgi:tRNA(Ile)-lysidine synthase